MNKKMLDILKKIMINQVHTCFAATFLWMVILISTLFFPVMVHSEEKALFDVSMTHAEKMYYGNQYQVDVTLTGTSDLFYGNLLLKFQIPAGLEYQNNINGCIIKWEIDELKPFETKKMIFLLTPVVNENKDYYLRSGVFSETSDILFIQDHIMKISESSLVLDTDLAGKEILADSTVSFLFKLTNQSKDICRNNFAEVYVSGGLKPIYVSPVKFQHTPDYRGSWDKIVYQDTGEINAGKSVEFKINYKTLTAGQGELVFRVDSSCGSQIFTQKIEIRSR